MTARGKFKSGDRVRYRFGSRDTGTIEKRAGAASKSGDWHVRWDNDPHGPRLLPAWEENLEHYEEGSSDGGNSTATET